MKTIITYGTFDMFHIGHLNLLKKLRDMGDRLVVGVSTDEFNLMKGKRTLIPYEQRSKIVEGCRYVDLVFAENSWDQKPFDIVRYGANIFAIGNDWEGKFDHLREYCHVVYLDRTEGISTTELKRSLKNFLTVPAQDVIKAFEILEALRRDLE